jgi:hypothetical protein
VWQPLSQHTHESPEPCGRSRPMDLNEVVMFPKMTCVFQGPGAVPGKPLQFDHCSPGQSEQHEH